MPDKEMDHQEKKIDDIEIFLDIFGKLWSVFKKCYLIVILTAVFCSCAFLYQAHKTYVPEYASSAKLYVRYGESTDGEVVDSTLIALTCNDVATLLNSKAVQDMVAEELGVTLVSGNIRASVQTDTRIINLTAYGSDPLAAKQIVDCICQIGVEKVEATIDFIDIEVFSYGDINETPVNSEGYADCVARGIVYAMLVYTVFFLYDMIKPRLGKKK